MTAIATTSPARTSNPPPTGWLMLTYHAAAAGFGALLACVAVFAQVVTGPVPRSVLILAGAVIFLVAFVSYATQHSKVLAADEARFLRWVSAHGPSFDAALNLMQDFAKGLPPTWKTDITSAKSRADQALSLAHSLSTSAPPSVDAVATEVVHRLASGVVAPAAPPVAPPAPSNVGTPAWTAEAPPAT